MPYATKRDIPPTIRRVGHQTAIKLLKFPFASPNEKTAKASPSRVKPIDGTA
jgi:cation transport regulator ChaB